MKNIEFYRIFVEISRKFASLPKEDLIKELDDIHKNITDQFFEPGDGAPLYDDPEALAANLTETVLQSSIQFWVSYVIFYDNIFYAKKKKKMT